MQIESITFHKLQGTLSARAEFCKAIFQPVDSTGGRIKHVRRLAGLSQEAFAEQLGVKRGAVGNWELGKGISAENLTQIAERFGASLDWLIGNRGEPPSVLTARRPSSDPQASAAPFPGFAEEAPILYEQAVAPIPGSALQGPNDFPIYASAEGGPGQIIVTSEPVEFVPRPAPLMRIEGAYGLLVTGESMTPEYRAGDTALVNPRLPLVPGEVYIFYTERDGEAKATIKHLRRVTKAAWQVSQWSPQNDFNLAREEWRLAHRVIGKFSRR